MLDDYRKLTRNDTHSVPTIRGDWFAATFLSIYIYIYIYIYSRGENAIPTHFLNTFFSSRERGVSSSFFKSWRVEQRFFRFFLPPFSGIVRSTPVSRCIEKPNESIKLYPPAQTTKRRFCTRMSLSNCGSCQSGTLGGRFSFSGIGFLSLSTARPSSSLDTMSPWNGH